MLFAHFAFAQSQERELEEFNSIDLAMGANLFLEPGDRQSLSIEGDAEMLEHIITEVNNGELEIKMDREWQSSNWKSTPTIRISIPELAALKVAGSGSAKTQRPFPGNELELAVTGSGDITMPVNTEELSLSITGSGNMNLQGEAQEADIRITGSGELNGSELSVQNCDIKISGSGGCRIRAEHSIEGRISGSGTIRYSGSPEVVNVQSHGSGKAVKVGK